MSDYLMAYYDKDRDAVVIQLQSGSEVSVMDLDEADSFADEVKAAARKESTGYEEYLAQDDDLDEKPLDSPVMEEFHPDEQVCASCTHPRPYAVAAATFLPDSACPGCGHVAPTVETEQGNYLIALTDNGDITLTDEHGNSVDAFRLTGALPTEAEDWDNYAQALGVTRTHVQAAVDALIAAEDSDFMLAHPNPGYGSDEPDEQALLDADDALRALDMDIVPGTCIITGEPGENPDDCTTHNHE